MSDWISRGALGAALLLALGCSEQVSSSIACPDLCTDQSATLRDTVLTGALVLGESVHPVALGVRQTFSDLGATVAEWLNVGFRGRGQSFLPTLERGH